jgi:hypothetical protein
VARVKWATFVVVIWNIQRAKSTSSRVKGCGEKERGEEAYLRISGRSSGLGRVVKRVLKASDIDGLGEATATCKYERWRWVWDGGWRAGCGSVEVGRRAQLRTDAKIPETPKSFG